MCLAEIKSWVVENFPMIIFDQDLLFERQTTWSSFFYHLRNIAKVGLFIFDIPLLSVVFFHVFVHSFDCFFLSNYSKILLIWCSRHNIGSRHNFTFKILFYDFLHFNVVSLCFYHLLVFINFLIVSSLCCFCEALCCLLKNAMNLL